MTEITQEILTVSHGEQGEISIYWYYKNGIVNTDRAYIANLEVKERYRNKGIGKLLVKACEDIAIKRGATKMLLKVKKHSWVREWYRKLYYEHYINDQFTDYEWMCKDFERAKFLSDMLKKESNKLKKKEEQK
ncbi:MAG: GNAT family N-acetyltransferase [Chloroflexota bacterium]